MSELFEMAKSVTDAHIASFKAGYEAGYKEGYRDAIAKAKELLAETFPKVCPTCGGRGASTVSKETGQTVYYCACPS